MNSIRDIISSLNESIEGISPSDSEINGVAELINRDEATLPEMDGEFVGIDDKFSVRVYHRITGMKSSIRSGTGSGRSAGDQVNNYAISMVVFLQKERTNLYPDELILLIQSNFPERLNMNPYKSIVLAFNEANLDSQSVWQQEYKSGQDYKLKSNQFLFKINYSIETTFSKGCFKQCP